MKNIIKKHIIRIKKSKKECSEKNIEKIGSLLGIKKITLNNKRTKLKIFYSLKFVNFKMIEKKLKEFGCPPAGGFIYLIKRNFINFTERNEIENLKHKHVDCLINAD